MTEKCCASCSYAEHFDRGNDVCYCRKHDRVTYCNTSKECHSSRFVGWVELTPDNKHELTEELLQRIIIGHIDNCGRMYTMTLIDCRLGISEMAKLGGFYYYVLPELKIE